MSKIKVNEIEAATGSTVTIPTGQTFSVVDGIPATNLSGTIADARLPTVPVSKGGTGLTSLGSANQQLRVNSSGNALEFASVSSGGLLKTDFSTFTTQITHTNTYVDISNSVSFTPTSASSDIIIMFNTLAYINASVGFAMKLLVDDTDIGTWRTNNPISVYSGSGTDYHTIMAMFKYDNTNTNAKTIKVQGRKYDQTNAYSQYNGRSSHLLIMEVGV